MQGGGEPDSKFVSLPTLSEDALTQLAFDAEACGWDHVRHMVRDERQRRACRE